MFVVLFLLNAASTHLSLLSDFLSERGAGASVGVEPCCKPTWAGARCGDRERVDCCGWLAVGGAIARQAMLRRLILANAALGFSLFGTVFWFPALFDRLYGFAPDAAGLVVALVGAAAFAGIWFGGPLADRNLRKGFPYLATFAARCVAVTAISWRLAFLSPWPAVTLPLLCGAAIAPIVIGVGSDVLQARGYSEAHALHWSVFASTASVISVAVWMVHRAASSCAEDAHRTITEFLMSLTQADPR